MHFNKEPYIFVIGNEKGGAGKTTCSMHLIISLLEMGYKVASIDADSRQHSLTTYIDNRKIYNSSNLDHQVDMPLHFHLKEVTNNSMKGQNAEEAQEFEKIFALAKHEVDYIVIDTPGSNTHFSRIAHSYANTVITPINDSFLDLDVLAKINSDTLEIEE
jgi:chromosome partitioning protein